MGGIKTLSKGQRTMSSMERKTCKYHLSKSLELLCEVCMDLVCVECVPTAHKGHTFVSLREVTPLRRNEVHHFIDITEGQNLAEIQQRISSASDIFKQDGRGCDDLEMYLEKQGSNLKADVDILKARRTTEYHKFKATNMEMRQIYNLKLKMVHGDLLRCLQEYKTLLGSDPDDVYIFDKAVIMKMIETLPTLAEYDSTRGTPQRNQQDNLEQVFGTLTDGPIKGLSLSNTTKSPGQLQNPSDAYEFVSKHLHPNPHLLALPAEYTVLPNTNVLTKFRSPRKISQICPTVDMAWTLFDNKVTLLDKTGKIQQQRIYDEPIKTIQVHPLTRQLYTFDDNGIIDLSTGARIFHYQATTKPTCLHFDSVDCILIGMVGKIAKFAPDGKHMITTTVSAFEKPFVFTPNKITECLLTGNIAFVDLDLQTDGGQGKRHVQVMNKEFQEGIKLSVETIVADGKTARKRRTERCDIEYDKGGNLVLVDGRTIFLIDMTTEKAIRTIHTDKHPVLSIGLGSHGELWVTLEGKTSKVKVLEYIDDHSR